MNYYDLGLLLDLDPDDAVDFVAHNIGIDAIRCVKEFFDRLLPTDDIIFPDKTQRKSKKYLTHKVHSLLVDWECAEQDKPLADTLYLGHALYKKLNYLDEDCRIEMAKSIMPKLYECAHALTGMWAEDGGLFLQQA